MLIKSLSLVTPDYCASKEIEVNKSIEEIATKSAYIDISMESACSSMIID